MKRLVIIVVLLLMLGIPACSKTENKTSIYDMTVNYLIEPMGIDADDSRVFLGWKIKNDTSNWHQTAYQIKIFEEDYSGGELTCVWDSTKVISDDFTGIPYTGEKLSPATRYKWDLQVWDNNDNLITSESFFETGLTNELWNEAKWIYAPSKQGYLNDQIWDYIINFDLRLDKIGAGFAFDAPKMEYGDYCLLSVEKAEDSLLLRLLKNDTTLWEQLVEGKNVNNEQEHQYSIVVSDGRNIEIKIDGEKVGEAEMEEDVPLGSYGLFVPKGFYTASYDNLEIIDSNKGVEIASEDFSNSTTIFSPYYVKIRDGKCQAKSGFTLVPGNEEPAPIFRKEFDTFGENIAYARLYASSKGIYSISINGKQVNDDFMGAGQSNYKDELFYRTYDVTEYMQSGENCIGVMLGHGRYDRAGHHFGENIEYRNVLIVGYKDGTQQVITTDDSWKCYTDGPIRNDDIYMGEYYDSNHEVKAWDQKGFDDGEWQPVATDSDDTPMRAAPTEPVRVVEYLSPVEVSEPVAGTFVFDFGQNINGACSITFDGKENDSVTMRFAELLNSNDLSFPDDEEGTIFTSNLLRADNTDYYICNSDGRVTYMPKFSYRGFRYMQLTGLTEEQIKNAEIKACVITSDLPRTGTFECSDNRLNKLYQSIVWTQIGNYVDFPTDCPQRDERFGWTGDAQVFAPTAELNFDCHTFLSNYIRLLVEGQSSNGSYPQIVLQGNETPVNGWSDAPVILTWEMYQQYGDIQIVKDNLESMARYVDCLVADSNEYVRNAYGYGDHNAVVGTDIDLINTAQCAYVSGLVAKMHRVIGDEKGYNKYHEIQQLYTEAWQSKFVNDDGSVGNWAPSEFALGLAFDLYPEELKQQAAEKLNYVLGLESFDYHPKTGFVTTPFIPPLLCEYGYPDTAYKIIMQDSSSSWLHLISEGATTMAETLTALDEDENGKKDVYTSLNHCGFGSVGEWFYTGILGIKRAEDNPGFKHFCLKPEISLDLTYAKGSYESVSGTIESDWELQKDGTYKYHCVIPANTEATIILPHAIIADDFHEIEYDTYEVESGEYVYSIPVTK